MRLRIHHQLFAGFLGVVGLMLVLIILAGASGLQRDLRATFQGELERQLALAAAIVSASDAGDPDALARSITDRIGYRVTLIDLRGVVLGDSYVEPDRLARVENHADRPEVRGVLAGSPVSFAERTSATVGVSLLYGARLAQLNGTSVVLRIAAPQTDIQGAVARVRRTVLVSGLVATLAALVVAYVLSMALARPLVTMADRAQRVSEGDLTSKVPLSSVAELRELGVVFNRLTDELRARLSELGRERDEMQTLIDCMAEGVIALTEDGRVLRMNRTARTLLELGEQAARAPIGSVTGDARLREALETSLGQDEQSCEIELRGRNLLLSSRALDLGGSVTTLLDITELRRLERVRRDFVTNASHELKTPLTSIRGYAETLVDDDPPMDVRRQFLESIRANTHRMQRLVEDLLDLSRLESGVWTAKEEPFDVASVVRDAADVIAPQADGKDVEIAIDGQEEAIGDRQATVQIMRNLLENSVRHSHSGGRVQVEIRRRPGKEGEGGRDTISVSVADQGEGIPGDSLPRIFERFYRADSARARDRGGTGLGLAIVKHLVVAMGGEVHAQSELGRGTTIGFTLPGDTAAGP